MIWLNYHQLNYFFFSLNSLTIKNTNNELSTYDTYIFNICHFLLTHALPCDEPIWFSDPECRYRITEHKLFFFLFNSHRLKWWLNWWEVMCSCFVNVFFHFYHFSLSIFITEMCAGVHLLPVSDSGLWLGRRPECSGCW